MVAARQHRIERRLLERGADHRAHLRPLPDDVVAAHPSRSGGRRQERRQHQHGRRLAGPVRPEEAVDLARLDAEVDRVHRPRPLLELAHERFDDDRVVLRHHSFKPTEAPRSFVRTTLAGSPSADGRGIVEPIPCPAFPATARGSCERRSTTRRRQRDRLPLAQVDALPSSKPGEVEAQDGAVRDDDEVAVRLGRGVVRWSPTIRADATSRSSQPGVGSPPSQASTRATNAARSSTGAAPRSASRRSRSTRSSTPAAAAIGSAVARAFGSGLVTTASTPAKTGEASEPLRGGQPFVRQLPALRRQLRVEPNLRVPDENEPTHGPAVEAT